MELTQRVAERLDLADMSLDDRLAEEARTNAEAFAPLYERHLERVYRYLRARGAAEDDAAELAALTFERALTHIDQYRPGGSGFGPWLLRIARNAFIDAGRRRHNRSLDLQEAAGLAAPGQSPEDAAIAAAVRAASSAGTGSASSPDRAEGSPETAGRSPASAAPAPARDSGAPETAGRSAAKPTPPPLMA